MSVREMREMHGLREFSVNRSLHAGFPKPLTEAQKEHNRAVERDAKLCDEYNNLQLKLCCLLDDKIFVAESLNYVTSKVTGMQVQNTRTRCESTKIGEGLPLTEKIKIVKTRLRDATLAHQNHIVTLQMLCRFLRGRTSSRPKDYPEPDTPELLYRAFKARCHGRHDQDLGFRSSNQPLSSPSYHNGTLLDSSLVDKDALRNQCEGDQPSDLIALSDSPSRILKIIGGWDYCHRKGDMIAVISVPKLLRMGVLFNRTTTLAKSLDVDLRTAYRPAGLRYANSNYWVAYRWIPAECIEIYISESFLRKACDSNSIGENDHDVRISLDEVISTKFGVLST